MSMIQNEKAYHLWDLVSEYLGMDPKSIVQSVASHMEFTLGKNRFTAEDFDIYESLAMSIRDRLVELWNDTQQTYYDQHCKRVYYLSLEYLTGRSLRNNLINLGIDEVCKKAMEQIGFDINLLEEMEQDAGLGNGGLGRLAACFLDSMATLQLPAYGYGIRYEYGIFKQQIEENRQAESPDNWIEKGYPWEMPRWELMIPVHYYGRVITEIGPDGREHFKWVDTQNVLAMAYDIPIPGYRNHTVNNLRLWSARAAEDFNFQSFDAGEYMRAVEEKQSSETISKVLYPNDKNFSGKELRLKQQYFFVAASLQDIMRRFKKDYNQNWDMLPEKIAIQLNDTHPSIAVPEFMRILVDDEYLSWEHAWRLTQGVFAYTNHTVLPEALEKWPVDMMSNLLPRHMQIIFEINHRFLEEVRQWRPGDDGVLSRMSLIEEGGSQQIRMPNLAIVGSHAVNGVAALHTDLLKATIFKDFYEMYPDRFQNKTNGITPRRWLRSSNPELSSLITEKIGDSWITHLDDLKQLIPYADKPQFRKEWQEVKHLKKVQFADWLKDYQGVVIDPNTLFDIQVKRIHEYKRQLLNVLHIITLFNRIRENPQQPVVPRTIMIGGKAAPGYYTAKLIIQLANDVARVVNNDPAMQGKLKVVFLENYCVSMAERLIPAAELSQHISTAGMEASGTSNMKFSLNGSLLIGTMDGANIEIREEVGDDNIFIFGLTTPEVMGLRHKGYNPRVYYQANREVREALEMINTGYFNRDNPYLYNDLYNQLIYNDHYLLLADYASYIECQEKVSEAYLDQERWNKMSILNTANMGKFSTDRTIHQYAEDIWGVAPVPIKAQKVR